MQLANAFRCDKAIVPRYKIANALLCNTANALRCNKANCTNVQYSVRTEVQHSECTMVQPSECIHVTNGSLPISISERAIHSRNVSYMFEIYFLFIYHSNHEHGYTLDPQPRRAIPRATQQRGTLSEQFSNRMSTVNVNQGEEESVIQNPRVEAMPLSPGLERDFPIHGGHAKTNDDLSAHKQKACSVSVGGVSYSIDVSYIDKLERANSLAEDYSSLLVHRQKRIYSTKLKSHLSSIAERFMRDYHVSVAKESSKDFVWPEEVWTKDPHDLQRLDRFSHSSNIDKALSDTT